MAETTFKVKYEGPALEDGRMPVRELAPALMALGELFTEASTTVYPDRPPVALDIHATEKGSFGIDLILNAADGPWGAAKDLFGSDGATALVNLKDLVLGGSCIGLVELIRRLRGQAVESEEPVAIDPGMVRVTSGNQTLEVPEEVLNLHKSVTVRKSAQAIVEPLGREGVESFKAISDEEITVEVGKADLPAFVAEDPPEAEVEEVLPETERNTIVQIAGILWGAKWKFTEGDDSPFFATIEDNEFLEGIAKGREAFREGDLLECVLRVQQRKVGGQLKAERQIIKVTKHIATAEEMTTDMLEAEAGPDAT